MNNATTEVRPTFKHVGPVVKFGDALISNDDAEEFRQTAQKGVRLKEFQLDNNQTLIRASSYNDGLLTDAFGDYEVYSVGYFSKTLIDPELDTWRSVITFARFNDKNRYTKIYNSYEVESHNGNVELAVRRVRVIRHLTRIAVDDDLNPVHEVYEYQRKAYQVPMLPDDIEHVDTLVERATSRSRITGGH